jgi:hypothetical protein
VNRAELVRLLATMAGDLERKGYPAAPVVRMGARELLEADREARDARERLEELHGAPGGLSGRSCAGCGSPLPVSVKGRPRRWCSERCRDRSRKGPVTAH